MQKTCIIIPCYNEEDRFPRDEFISYYKKNRDIYYCLVNDGSNDGTLSLLHELRKLRESRILVVDLGKNKGKGEAIRIGIQRTMNWKNFKFLAYFDADFSTPLYEVERMLKIANDDYWLIMGSRIRRMGSNIIRSDFRHYLGRVFATIVGTLLKLPVYDTQCGAKLIKSSIAGKIFKNPFYSKWLFDIEIIFRFLKEYGYYYAERYIYEIPLTEWIEKGGTKLKILDFIKSPVILYQLNKKYRNMNELKM